MSGEGVKIVRTHYQSELGRHTDTKELLDSSLPPFDKITALATTHV